MMDNNFAPVKKYVYVKQHVMDNIKSGKSKILINPNFIKPPVVHINPHFKANLTIHVNPNVVLQKPLTSNTRPMPETKVVHQPIITANKVIRVPPKLQTSNICLPSKPQTTNNPINHKPQTLNICVPLKPHTNNITTYKKPQRSYMRVSQTTNIPVPQKLQTTNKYKVVNITPKQKNPFRLDNRTPKKTVSNKRIKRLVSLPNKNVYVKCNKKVSPNVNRKRLTVNKLTAAKVCRSLTISGKKYKIDANNRKLTILTNKVLKTARKKTPVNMKQNLCVKNNLKKRILLSQEKYRSITILKNKHKKSNVPCPFYRKFGKCKGKENGRCIRIHNMDQVSLCPKFLQGACLNKACLLSHKVSAEKMPTCKFYLEGMCSKDDCPYLHVKINRKAEICRDFLEGFCKKAAECEKRHQYLCPDFEQKGKCEKKRCHYPHRSVVRDNKVFDSVPLKLQNQIKKTLTLKPIEIPEKLGVRYYDETFPKVELSDVQAAKLDENSNQTNSNNEPLKKRPQLGDLPSFIPC